MSADETTPASVEEPLKDSSAESGAAPDEGAAGEAESWRHGPLPPPTLTTLLGTLYTQAMLSMGYVPHPATGKPEVHLDEARHMIDTLTMLEEKTHGNRTPEEINLFSRLLHEVRLAFVEASKQAKQS
jgi:Domain of unknown function (DUF1844)